LKEPDDYGHDGEHLELMASRLSENSLKANIQCGDTIEAMMEIIKND